MALGNWVADSLDDGESGDNKSEKWVSSSRMDATILSCRSFLLLSALFLRNVALISKSRGAKLPVEDLCMYNTNRTAVIQLNKKRQIEIMNKYSQKQSKNNK